MLEVQPALVRLLGSVAGVKQVIPRGQTWPNPDLYCHMMSLPAIFDTRLDSIPAAIPYLAVDDKCIDTWRNRLLHSGNHKLKVGLTWAGRHRINSPDFIAADRRRSIPPALFAPLTKIGGVQFYSLQKDGPRAPAEMKLVDMMDACNDFVDTAALVANLDLIISVDTAVVHLAGALGKPVWVLNRFDSCWRWLQTREDSPWYPTLRLFNQPRPGDWESVVVCVANELRKALVNPAAQLQWLP